MARTAYRKLGAVVILEFNSRIHSTGAWWVCGEIYLGRMSDLLGKGRPLRGPGREGQEASAT